MSFLALGVILVASKVFLSFNKIFLQKTSSLGFNKNLKVSNCGSTPTLPFFKSLETYIFRKITSDANIFNLAKTRQDFDIEL